MKAEYIWSLIISVIVFGFVLYSSRTKAKDGAQLTDTPQPASRLPESQERLHRRLWRATKWAIATGAAVLAFLAAIDQFWGRPWPTPPEVHARDVLSASSLVLPFTVRNKSLFDMKDVELFCGVDSVLFEDARKGVAGIESGVFSSGLFSIPGGETINYPCDASGLFEIRDGALVIRRSAPALRTKPGLFQPPITILKMCIWVGTDWKFAGMKWRFNSNIFKWPASQQIHQWVEGPMARRVPYKERVEMWATPDEIECSDAVAGTYMLFREGQHPKKVEDILQR